MKNLSLQERNNFINMRDDLLNEKFSDLNFQIINYNEIKFCGNLGNKKYNK